jgi:hypothetical protein
MSSSIQKQDNHCTMVTNNNPIEQGSSTTSLHTNTGYNNTTTSKHTSNINDYDNKEKVVNGIDQKTNSITNKQAIQAIQNYATKEILHTETSVKDTQRQTLGTRINIGNKPTIKIIGKENTNSKNNNSTNKQKLTALEEPTNNTITLTSLQNLLSRSKQVNDQNLYKNTNDSSEQTATDDGNIKGIHKGHSHNHKKHGHVRFYYQNINSLRPKNMIKWKNTISQINQLSADFVGMTETSVNWQLNKLLEDFNRVLIKENRNNRLIVSSINTNLKNYYIPGGTATITTGKWVSKLVENIVDPTGMGRWSGTKLRVKNNLYLHYITAYRVCNQKLKKNNSLSSYAQQHMHLLQSGKPEPNPRQEVLDDLKSYITTKSSDDYFIIGIDANESASENNSGINIFINETNLIDIYTYIHSEEEFGTHINGSKRIDYMLCSANIKQYVSQVGMLKFQDGFDSDHRGIFCDLDQELFKNNTLIQTHQTRHIGTNSTNKEGEQYIRKLDSLLFHQQIYNKLNTILHKVEHDKTLNKDKILEEIYKIDTIITESMLLSEKQNCKLKSTALWTPELYQCNLLIQYVNLLHKSKKQKINISHRLDYLYGKMTEQTKHQLETFKENTENMRQQAIRQYNKIVNDTSILREKYLQSLIDDLNDRDPRGKQTLRGILHREQTKSDFKIIRKLYKGNRGNGIQSLEIPDEANKNKWITITDPSVIEEKLIERNKAHFGQSKDTVFASGPLQNYFQYEGTNNNSRSLIAGQKPTQILKDQTNEVEWILDKLGDKQSTPEIPDNITFDEFCEGLKTWNERTTTSPSGRHLGHYKILLRLQIYNQFNENISKRILYSIYQVIKVMAMIGETLPRWCNVSTCMIEKVKGLSRIDKLRVIHLYEADYNLVLKIIWARKSVWNAEKNNTLHEGQSGSRPNHRAIDVVLRKEMRYMYARMTRTQLGTIDNDAKSCFDRILCNIAMLVSNYNGIPINFCKMQASTLRKTKFKLRTALGDSTKHYSHSEDTPIHGTGQGSCASPAIWLLLSSLLMEILQKHGNGMTMIDVLNNGNIIKEIIEGFVDDNSIFTNEQTNNIIQLLQKLKEDGNMWAQLLQASGGMLELGKCFFYLLTWTWDSKGNPVPANINSQKLLTNSEGIYLNGSKEILRQKEVQDSHKTLGTYKCLVGKEQDHVGFLTEKSNRMASQLDNCQLNRRQALRAYTSCYIPALLYSLTAVSLSRTKIDNIQQKATTAFLRKCGFDMHFPRAVVYGSIKFGGLGFQQLYVASCCNKIQSILCHINSETMLGRMFLINLNWTQLLSGLGTSILQDNQRTTNYITDNWFDQIREYNNYIGAKITIQNCWTPAKKRENDNIIMDIVTKLNMVKSKLQIFNNWRIYYQVDSIADVTNANGDCLQDQFINRKLALSYKSTSRLHWPQQAMPCIKSFSIWSDTIKQIIGTSTNGNLKVKLGAWLVPHYRYRYYNYLIHKTGSFIIIKEETTWRKSQQSHTGRSKVYFTKNGNKPYNIDGKFSEFYPIDISENQKFYYSTNRFIIQEASPIQAIQIKFESNFKKFLMNDNNLYKHMMKSVQVFDESFITIHCINNLSICSDGGAKNDKGSIGIVIKSHDRMIVKLCSRIPNGYDDINSHRSECYGILISVYLISLMQQYYTLLNTGASIRPHSVTLCCDNKSAVNTINKLRNRKIPLKQYWSPNSDLIMATLSYINKIGNNAGSIKLLHIDGHQDRQKSKVSGLAELNIIADHLATNGLSQPPIRDIIHNTDKAVLFLNNQKVTSNHTRHLIECFSATEMYKYYFNKYNWSQKTLGKIWWEVHGAALQSFGAAQRISIQKFIHDRAASNYRENLYYTYKSPFCATCGVEQETLCHILKCNKCSKRHLLRKKYMMNMKDKMIYLGTNADTVRVVTTYLRAWLYDLDYPNILDVAPDASPHLKRAVTEQNDIGWGQWFRGRVSTTWSELYNHDISVPTNIVKYPSTKRWGKELLKITWQFVLECWYSRNLCEHDTDGDPITRAKDKLVEEILWNIKNKEESVPSQYKTLKYEELIIQPKDNLCIMNEQLKQLYKKK